MARAECAPTDLTDNDTDNHEQIHRQCRDPKKKVAPKSRKHRATYFLDMVDARQVIQSMRTLFRHRPNNLRPKIILLCSIVFLTTFYYGTF